MKEPKDNFFPLWKMVVVFGVEIVILCVAKIDSHVFMPRETDTHPPFTKK